MCLQIHLGLLNYCMYCRSINMFIKNCILLIQIHKHFKPWCKWCHSFLSFICMNLIVYHYDIINYILSLHVPPSGKLLSANTLAAIFSYTWRVRLLFVFGAFGIFWAIWAAICGGYFCHSICHCVRCLRDTLAQQYFLESFSPHPHKGA